MVVYFTMQATTVSKYGLFMSSGVIGPEEILTVRQKLSNLEACEV